MWLCVIILSFWTVFAKDTNEPLTPILPNPNLQWKAEPMTKEGLAWQTTTKKDKCSAECNWIKLNTCFPIIWNCIWDDANESPTNAFPTMVWALSKIIVSVILVVCFIIIIVAWIMWASAGEDASQRTSAKNRIIKVWVTIILLWFSWVILRLINPNFFG